MRRGRGRLHVSWKKAFPISSIFKRYLSISGSRHLGRGEGIRGWRVEETVNPLEQREKVIKF